MHFHILWMLLLTTFVFSHVQVHGKPNEKPIDQDESSEEKKEKSNAQSEMSGEILSSSQKHESTRMQSSEESPETDDKVLTDEDTRSSNRMSNDTSISNESKSKSETDDGKTSENDSISLESSTVRKSSEIENFESNAKKEKMEKDKDKKDSKSDDDDVNDDDDDDDDESVEEVDNESKSVETPERVATVKPYANENEGEGSGISKYQRSNGSQTSVENESSSQETVGGKKSQNSDEITKTSGNDSSQKQQSESSTENAESTYDEIESQNQSENNGTDRSEQKSSEKKKTSKEENGSEEESNSFSSWSSESFDPDSSPSMENEFSTSVAPVADLLSTPAFHTATKSDDTNNDTKTSKLLESIEHTKKLTTPPPADSNTKILTTQASLPDSDISTETNSESEEASNDKRRTTISLTTNKVNSVEEEEETEANVSPVTHDTPTTKHWTTACDASDKTTQLPNTSGLNPSLTTAGGKSKGLVTEDNRLERQQTTLVTRPRTKSTVSSAMWSSPLRSSATLADTFGKTFSTTWSPTREAQTEISQGQRDSFVSVASTLTPHTPVTETTSKAVSSCSSAPLQQNLWDRWRKGSFRGCAVRANISRELEDLFKFLICDIDMQNIAYNIETKWRICRDMSPLTKFSLCVEQERTSITKDEHTSFKMDDFKELVTLLCSNLSSHEACQFSPCQNILSETDQMELSSLICRKVECFNKNAENHLNCPFLSSGLRHGLSQLFGCHHHEVSTTQITGPALASAGTTSLDINTQKIDPSQIKLSNFSFLHFDGSQWDSAAGKTDASTWILISLITALKIIS